MGSQRRTHNFHHEIELQPVHRNTDHKNSAHRSARAGGGYRPNEPNREQRLAYGGSAHELYGYRRQSPELQHFDSWVDVRHEQQRRKRNGGYRQRRHWADHAAGGYRRIGWNSVKRKISALRWHA